MPLWIYIQYTRHEYMRLETQDSCIIIVVYLFVFANKSYDPIHPENGSLWISGYSNVCPVKMIMCRHFEKCGHTHSHTSKIRVGQWLQLDSDFFNHFREIQRESKV